MGTEIFSLCGKAALVTGSATGIGRAIALALSQAGARVVGLYNSHEPDGLKADIERAGGEFTGLRCDLGQVRSFEELVEQAAAVYGRLDILANVAGICPRGSIYEFKEQDWDDTIRINQKAVYFLSQAVAKRFRRQNSRGKIINIASMLTFVGGVNASAYAASKHAVAGITKAMASEAGADNINVNAIAPGWFATDLAGPIMADEQRNASILSRLPVGRWGDPSELGGTAVFLASAASDMVNGVVIPVDGGYLTR